MNATSIYRSKTFYVLTLLFFFCCWMAVTTQQNYFLLIPFIAIVGLWLLKHFKISFFILLAAIPWSIEYSVTETLSTDLPDEPLMLLISLLVIIWACFHYKQWTQNINLHPLIFLLIIQVLWIMITIFFSSHPLVSIKYLLAKSWYLLAFVAAPLILFINKKIFIKSVMILLVSMLLFTCITMVRHGFNGFRFDTINPSLEPFYRNHVNYSALLVFMVPILWAIAKLKNKSTRKGTIIFFTTITIVAVYFSYARGAWLALIAGFIIFWLIKHRALFTAFLLSMLILVAAFFFLKKDDLYLKYAHDYNTTVFHTDFSEHLMATYQMRDVSTAERFYRWVAGVRMLKDSWKTGFGPNTFFNNYRYYTIPAFETWVSDNEDKSTVHNYFLLLLIEQGIIGFLLFVTLLGALFWYAQKIYLRAKDLFWKYTAAAIAAILGMICVVNLLSDLIETDKVGSIFYMCIAALVIADIQTRKEGKTSV